MTQPPQPLYGPFPDTPPTASQPPQPWIPQQMPGQPSQPWNQQSMPSQQWVPQAMPGQSWAPQAMPPQQSWQPQTFGPPSQYQGVPTQQTPPPKKHTTAILIAIIGVVVVGLVVALIFWVTSDDSTTQPSGTTTTQATQPEPAGSTAPANGPSSAQPAPPANTDDPGIIQVNQSFTDTGTNTTVKVIAAGTNWINPLPNAGTTGGSSPEVLYMIGIQVDTSPALSNDDLTIDITVSVPGQDFVPCMSPNSMAAIVDAPAITQAISGDPNGQPYQNGSGWVMCTIPAGTLPVPNGTPYTLEYQRFGFMSGSNPSDWDDGFSYSISIP